jgi:hypothetical protein
MSVYSYINSDMVVSIKKQKNVYERQYVSGITVLRYYGITLGRNRRKMVSRSEMGVTERATERGPHVAKDRWFVDLRSI